MYALASARLAPARPRDTLDGRNATEFEELALNRVSLFFGQGGATEGREAIIADDERSSPQAKPARNINSSQGI